MKKGKRLGFGALALAIVLCAAAVCLLPGEEAKTAEPIGLQGAWALDAAYTEGCNPGLSLGETSAYLRIGGDGAVEFGLGECTGRGVWQPDGDTGRYAVRMTLSPEEREETLSFYEFRESAEGAGYLLLEYEGRALYWVRAEEK